MKRFSIITLGCKVNQCESAAIGQLLERTGHSPDDASGTPEIVVINTCAVTGKAAMQSRQAIRQAIRNYPSARIVVTGCYAQTAADEIDAIDGVDLIVAHKDKMRVHELISAHGARMPGPIEPYRDRNLQCEFTALPPVTGNARTRFFLKIQDGCNTRCTYCIVPYARGGSCSMPGADVLSHLELLGNSGFKEVVLTGIHLGAYGADLSPPTSLVELLKAITPLPGIRRIRLSSIEPTEINDALIDLIKTSNGRICRHLHIPLQSGDNAILRRMGRPYTREQFRDIVQRVHSGIPDIAIGVDVMSGFPGETEEAFDNAYRLIDDLPVAYLHVFPFSPRKGTPAAGFRPKVPERITKERCRVLRQLGEKKKRAFYNALIDKTVQVLVEKNSAGTASGLSDNYIPVQILNADVPENSMVNARIEHVSEDQKVVASVNAIS